MWKMSQWPPVVSVDDKDSKASWRLREISPQPVVVAFARDLSLFFCCSEDRFTLKRVRVETYRQTERCPRYIMKWRANFQTVCMLRSCFNLENNMQTHLLRRENPSNCWWRCLWTASWWGSGASCISRFRYNIRMFEAVIIHYPFNNKNNKFIF